MRPPLLLGYYGDDFTGSTDVLEALSVRGVPTVLFLAPPEPDVIARKFPQVRAIGIAGIARSLPAERMTAEIDPAFAALQVLAPRFAHYKICSTFDSSPEVGSIGVALESGCRHFGSTLIPLAVGAPALRRFVAFGNLFAGFGDEVIRLDRHPTMSRHPATPMHEADLARHLSKQTALACASIDSIALQNGLPKLVSLLQQNRDQAEKEGSRILIFDTITESDLSRVGAALGWLGENSETPVFVAGSSGVEYALASYWHAAGIVDSPLVPPPIEPVEQMFVMSGSAAPQTAVQLDHIQSLGWLLERIEVRRLLDRETSAHETDRLERIVLEGLRQGRSVALFTARGQEDAGIFHGFGVEAGLGVAQGKLLARILARSGLRRICVAGGDTSGHVAQQLGIYALEFVAPVAPGSPLCRARSSTLELDGLEIALKGGQNGPPEYFERLRTG